VDRHLVAVDSVAAALCFQIKRHWWNLALGIQVSVRRLADGITFIQLLAALPLAFLMGCFSIADATAPAHQLHI